VRRRKRRQADVSRHGRTAWPAGSAVSGAELPAAAQRAPMRMALRRGRTHVVWRGREVERRRSGAVACGREVERRSGALAPRREVEGRRSGAVAPGGDVGRDGRGAGAARTIVAIGEHLRLGRPPAAPSRGRGGRGRGGRKHGVCDLQCRLGEAGEERWEHVFARYSAGRMECRRARPDVGGRAKRPGKHGLRGRGRCKGNCTLGRALGSRA
jgi:hypothetical protein